MKKFLILLLAVVLCVSCDGTWLIDPVPDPVIIHTPYYGPYINRPYWDRPIFVNPPRPIISPFIGGHIGSPAPKQYVGGGTQPGGNSKGQRGGRR